MKGEEKKAYVPFSLPSRKMGEEDIRGLLPIGRKEKKNALTLSHPKRRGGERVFFPGEKERKRGFPIFPRKRKEKERGEKGSPPIFWKREKEWGRLIL